ncbi:hypothetical protein PRIPAC_76234, partial [Pristionchus pacificus]|uniref:Uncharacterized protein n=1 Tax=Pristionchus pacificus TaxID=54126 RepID=A0A2A6C5B0_PRIPA
AAQLAATASTSTTTAARTIIFAAGPELAGRSRKIEEVGDSSSSSTTGGQPSSESRTRARDCADSGERREVIDDEGVIIMTTLAPSRSNSSASAMSEEDAIPLFIYTLEMFLLWFSVLLSACILTFLMRLKKFPIMFRVIYCVWNLRNLAVAVARTSSLVLVIFKEQGATSDYILAQAHEAIECISAFAVAALAVERLIANRLQKTYEAWKPANEHVVMVVSAIVVPALCAAVTHKNFPLPRLIFTVFSAFLFGTTLGLILTGLYYTRSRRQSVAISGAKTGGRAKHSLQAAAIFFPLALHDTIVRLILDAGNLILSSGKGGVYGTVSDVVHMLSAYQCLSYAINSFARLHRHVPSRIGVAPNVTNTQSASATEKPPDQQRMSIVLERLDVDQLRASETGRNSSMSLAMGGMIHTPSTRSDYDVTGGKSIKCIAYIRNCVL